MKYFKGKKHVSTSLVTGFEEYMEHLFYCCYAPSPRYLNLKLNDAQLKDAGLGSLPSQSSGLA